jgi:DNA-binding CsgD family transcriptional regulator
MSQEVTLDEYRTGYISERHDVSDNCARALQLAEIGCSASGISNILGVTEGTARKYMSTLTDKVGTGACWSIGGSRPSLDVWGERSLTEYGAADYSDGVAAAKEAAESAENAQYADSPEKLDPEFRPRETPLNKGSVSDETIAALGTVE